MGIAGALALVPFLLPNPVIEKAGYAIGFFLSKVLRQKIGKDSEQKVEGWIKGTVSHFVAGLTNGMDAE